MYEFFTKTVTTTENCMQKSAFLNVLQKCFYGIFVCFRSLNLLRFKDFMTFLQKPLSVWKNIFMEKC